MLHRKRTRNAIYGIKSYYTFMIYEREKERIKKKK